MSYNNMIAREMKKGSGQIKIVPVPKEKRPTAQSLKKLDREITAQVNANEAMSNRSVLLAAKPSHI